MTDGERHLHAVPDRADSEWIDFSPGLNRDVTAKFVEWRLREMGLPCGVYMPALAQSAAKIHAHFLLARYGRRDV